VDSVKKSMCQNFDDYEIDFFDDVCVCFFPIGGSEGAGSDGNAESGRNAFYQGYFRAEASDATGFLL